MADPTFTIREAVDDDWSQLLPVLRGLVEAGETYDWAPDVSDDALHQQWLEQPGWTTVVAVEVDVAGNDHVLGVADFGPNRGGRGAHVANASFVVAPRAAGRGVGRALGRHVLAAAADAGFLAMQFNAVVETNTRAVALWQSLGFEILTTVPEGFDHPQQGLVGLHVMHRRLGPPVG